MYPSDAFDTAPIPRLPSSNSNVRTHRWGLGAFIVAEATFLLSSLGLAALLLAGDGPVAAWRLALGIVLPALAAAGLALLITKVRGNGPRIDLRLYWSWRDLGIGVAFGVGGWFVTLPAAYLYSSIVGPDGNSAVGLVFSDVRASVGEALLVFAVVTIIVPICEEILYRGLLWGALERRWGVATALVVSTVVFALAHFEPTRAPLLLVVAMPLALARFYSGGLLAGIVAHQITNLLPGIVVALGLLGMMPAP